MNLFEKLIKGTVNQTTNLGAVFLVAVMLLICINVIYRIFSGVIPGQYELVEIIIVVVAGFAICDTEIHRRQTSRRGHGYDAPPEKKASYGLKMVVI